MEKIPFYENTTFLDKLPIRISTSSTRQTGEAHIHRNFQMCFILSGNANHRIDGIEYKYNAGSCALFPPYIVHSINSTVSEETPIFVYISFYDDFLTSRGYDFFPYGRENASFCGYKIPHFCSFGEKRDDAMRIIREAINEFNLKSKMSYDKIADLIGKLFSLICTEPLNAPPNHTFIKATNKINNAVKFIDANFPQKITIDTLCELCGMSRRSFTEHFKAVTGLTVTNFILAVRLHHAAGLLATTDILYDEIAARSGLGDHSNLAYVFQKYTEHTPSEFGRLWHSRIFAESKIPLYKRYQWINEI